MIDMSVIHQSIGRAVEQVARQMAENSKIPMRVVNESGVWIEVLDQAAVEREYSGSPWVMQWLGGG